MDFSSSRRLRSTPAPSRASSVSRRTVACRRSKRANKATLDSTPSASASSGHPSKRSRTQGYPTKSSSVVGSHVAATTELGSDHERAGSLSDEQVSDDLVEVIMAVDMKDNGNVGSAYYVASDETLYLLEDVLCGGIEIVRLVLAHAQPTTILAPSRVCSELVSFLDKGASRPSGLSDEDGERRGAYVFRQYGLCEFSHDTAVSRLNDVFSIGTSGVASLHGGKLEEGSSCRDNESGYESRTANLDQSAHSHLSLGTVVNLDSVLSIGCASAVIGDLQRRRVARANCMLEDLDNIAVASFAIKRVKTFSLTDFMFVNVDTLTSLRIIDPEIRVNRPGKCEKNSPTLFSLIKPLAATVQGRQRLRNLFLRPSTNLATIRERHRTIAVLLRPDNAEMLKAIHKSLRKVGNMRTIVSCLEKGIETPSRSVAIIKHGVWGALQRFSATFLQLLGHLQGLSDWESLSMLPQLVNAAPREELWHVGEMIGKTIDFKKTQETLKTCVALEVDERLDDLRREYDGLESFLDAVATEINQELPEWAKPYVQGCKFFPQIGFLIVVTQDAQTGRGRYEGERSNDPQWQILFTIEDMVYYKNQRMRDLDERFGDMYCRILDREIEILHEISVKVLEYKDALLVASESCADIDCFVALALGAIHYKWNAPSMVNDRIIDIRDGRHPLLEQIVPSFIPNDCRLGSYATHESLGNSTNESSPSVMILTGPNQSGKSIYLKQVALIVYLAQIGSYVPASSAVIGIADRLLTRIATKESVSRDESAFATDLKQVGFSLKFATKQSLILIDEFGKGTGAADGIGLFTALVEHYCGMSPDLPRVLITTHFHEALENGFVEEGPDVQMVHMDVQVDSANTVYGEGRRSHDEVTYLYKLAPGKSSSSLGSVCARLNGVDDAVVQRSEEIAQMLAQNADIALIGSAMTDSRREAADEVAAEVAKRLLLIDFASGLTATSSAKDVLAAVLGKS